MAQRKTLNDESDRQAERKLLTVANTLRQRLRANGAQLELSQKLESRETAQQIRLQTS